MYFTHEFLVNPNVFSTINSGERAALLHLIAAIKLIARLYEKQQNPKFLGANFYPHDATRVELEQAGVDDPTVLSPYTVVLRGGDGKLTTIPFHKQFARQLHRVAKLLLKASIVSEDADFSLYLQTRAHALTDGNYREADIAWLTGRPFPLNVMVGPIERYDDRLFFKKCAYRGWASVLNKELTQEANRFKDVMYKSYQPLRRSSQAPILQKMRVRVDDPLVFAGQIAKNMVISTNLPNDVNLMQQYGSLVTIFSTVITERFDHELLPLYRTLFAESFRREYPIEMTKRAALRHAYWHELAHPLGRYVDAEDRLQELFPVFDELFATITGTKLAGTLFLKDFISQKELEASVIMLILQACYSYLESQIRPGRMAYMHGYALMINYFFECGSLKEARGKLWPNFAKIYVCLDELCHMLENVLAHGTYKGAQAIVAQLVKPEIFERSLMQHKKVKGR